MGLVLDVLGALLVAGGVFLIAVAAIGLLRLPDAYARMNAVTKAASLGVVLAMAGALLITPSWFAVVKLLLAIALQLVTAPVGGFALGRAAYRAGTPLASETRFDELGDAIERAGNPRPVQEPSPPG
ncbi:monovalent cation/H(+) antiporter subunit G [Trujillonella humicola]|uniref:monovalent cation/H(+) antiporter subunit G n=1 Tax=Trujillonella humicola TaxID=3383699 RepID=UPI003905F101